MMFLYICALRDGKKGDMVAQLYTEDPAARDRFAAHYDQPGLSVYQCVSLLTERRRSKDAVGSVPFLHVDIDLKRLLASRETVQAKLEEMTAYLPLEVRDSGGGGFHIAVHLKEAGEPAELERIDAIRKELTSVLCGDPAPAHSCALLRHVGTRNSKHGEAKLCRVIRPGAAVDLTDIETFLEIFSAPQFEVKPEIAERTNGHTAGRTEPADLAAISNGETANAIQPSVITRLLGLGNNPNDVVAGVAEGTMAAINAVGNPDGWTLDTEIICVRKRVLSSLLNKFLAKHDHTDGTIPDWLCLDWHEKWAAILKEGYRPTVGLNRGGFYVRRAQVRKPEGTDVDDAAAESSNAAHSAHSDGNGGGTKTGPKRGLFTIRPFVPFDPATLPRRQWLFGRHYLRRTVSCTSGPGGYGKSTLDMVEGVSMTTGLDLLGERPSERLRVWLHNGEDSLEEMMRRLAAICQHYGIPQQELVNWFFMTSGNEVPLRIAEGYNRLDINESLIRRIHNQIEENEIDVVILDPLITLHGVPESDNTKMDGVIRIFAGIADAHDCGIEISHHMRKPSPGSNGDYMVSDIRGASAIHDAVRSARILNRMSERDALDLSMHDHDRARYFRVDKAKGNYSPAAKAVWRQFVNVELANGDDVGVIVPWEYPGQGEGTPEREELERTAEYVFLQLLSRFTLQGENVSSRKQGNYAPRIFAKDSEAKVARLNTVLLEGAMRRLFEKKKIRSEETGKKGVHRIVAS